MRFLGNIEARLDAKGRVFLPAAFRKVLQQAGEEQLVMRHDVHQQCLVVYPLSAWNRRTDALLARVNEFDDRSQMVFRQYVAAAEELTLDASGRFLLPRRHIEWADIQQAVRFIGMNDTIEIWAAEKASAPFLPQEEFAAQLKTLMCDAPT